jgi:hypothetical protein
LMVKLSPIGSETWMQGARKGFWSIWSGICWGDQRFSCRNQNWTRYTMHAWLIFNNQDIIWCAKARHSANLRVFAHIDLEKLKKYPFLRHWANPCRMILFPCRIIAGQSSQLEKIAHSLGKWCIIANPDCLPGPRRTINHLQNCMCSSRAWCNRGISMKVNSFPIPGLGELMASSVKLSADSFSRIQLSKIFRKTDDKGEKK